MRTTADCGRVYRRCGCRDAHRHQLGAHCPGLLTDTHHGTWTPRRRHPHPHTTTGRPSDAAALPVTTPPRPRCGRSCWTTSGTATSAHSSPASSPPGIWTAHEAARFLHYCHEAHPDMADLFEFLIGTGLRKVQALGLHWDDVHLSERVLYVRCTLSAIDNNQLVITTSKTRSSKNWLAISFRVAALQHRARSRAHAHSNPSPPSRDWSSADPTADRSGPAPPAPRKPRGHSVTSPIPRSGRVRRIGRAGCRRVRWARLRGVLPP